MLSDSRVFHKQPFKEYRQLLQKNYSTQVSKVLITLNASGNTWQHTFPRMSDLPVQRQDVLTLEKRLNELLDMCPQV